VYYPSLSFRGWGTSNRNTGKGDPALAAALTVTLLATGFLGGYITFSTYALGGVLLYRDGLPRLALLNLLGSVAVGLLAAAAGAGIARLLAGA